MEEIFKVISEKPEYFAWAFGVANALWLAFIYFNKKRHEKELIVVKQSFDLDLERRKKVFEMKVSQYESYFRNIDEIHNRHQTDYYDVVLPIINDFNSAYMYACDVNDTKAATEATIAFSERMGKLTRDGFQELQIMRSETNSLRLTASDSVAILLDDIQAIYEQLFEASNKIISDLVHVTLNNDQELAEKNQAHLTELGKLALLKSNELREQMRVDLKEI
ncbi:MAG: hypothetical protein ABJN96_10180 [Marinomonas sp.]